MRQTRNRRILILIGLLFLGQLTTVLVAVTCALWATTPTLREIVPRGSFADWPRPVPGWPQPTARTVYSNAIHTLILHQAMIYSDSSSDQQIGASHYQWLYRYGWPMNVLEAESRATASTQPELLFAYSPVPSWIPHDRNSFRFIPTRLLWSGFAVDSILYAVLFWSMGAGVWASIRYQRMVRGLCPNCKYPVNESPRCPECGTVRPGARGAAAATRSRARSCEPARFRGRAWLTGELQ